MIALDTNVLVRFLVEDDKAQSRKAKELIEANRDKLEILTRALLDKETLQAKEVYELLGIEPRTIHRIS